MILLDTNVISEMLKAAPDARVAAWLDAQAAETLFLSSITVSELLFGVAVLPESARKDRLLSAIDGALGLFAGRVLAFDEAAARAHAGLAATARAAGRAFPTPDGYVAAIAAVRGFAVATRDVRPFEAAGVPVVDPWAG